jgi:two-component system, response regulator YesN
MMKAVIIDDDMTTIQGLTRSVRWSDFGIQVVGNAKNGKDGLEQIRLHRPDIILTDIFMPVMDGIEMLKAVREEGNHAEVIILSGYEDFKYAQSAVKLKVNDYLSKPATLEEIERVLKETVDKLNLKEQSDKVDKELRELLEYNLPTTRQQLLKGLLEPEFCHSAFFRKVSDYLKMDFTNQCFTVVLIEFFINRERTSYKPSELSLFAYAVKNIVDELSQNKKGVYVADIQRNVITVIVSTPAHMKNEYAKRCAIQAAMEFLEHIQSYLKLKVWASVGMVADDVKDIPKSYSAAVDLLAERVRVSDKQLITGEDVLEKGKAASRRPMECYQAIADAVILGQEDLVEERINELTKALHHEPAPSINVLREFAIDIVGIIALGLHDHGIPPATVTASFLPIGNADPNKDALMKGNVPIMGPQFTATFPAYENIMKDKIDMVPIPRDQKTGSAILPAMFLSTSAQTKHPKEAAMFLDFFLNSKEAADILEMERGLPENKKILEYLTPKFTDRDKKMVAMLQHITSIQPSMYDGGPKGTGEVTKLFEQTVQKQQFGKLTIDEAVAEFRKEADKVFEKNNN